MLKEKTKNYKNKQGGFTLLFAVLVSTLILAVGASMITIALKQLTLSSAGRESQFAFYAANTGLECALYWDLHPQVENDGSLKNTFPAKDQNVRNDFDNVICSGGQIKDGIGFSSDPDNKFTTEASEYVWDSSVGTYPNSYTFRISIQNTEPGFDDILYCAQVTVEKTGAVNSRVNTKITSQGLNTCDPEGNQRAVERALILEYVS